MNNASRASAVKVSARVCHRVWIAIATPIVIQVCSVRPRLCGPTNLSARNTTSQTNHAQMTSNVPILTSVGSRRVRSVQLTPNGALRYTAKTTMLSSAGTVRVLSERAQMTSGWMDATVRAVLPHRLHRMRLHVHAPKQLSFRSKCWTSPTSAAHKTPTINARSGLICRKLMNLVRRARAAILKVIAVVRWLISWRVFVRMLLVRSPTSDTLNRWDSFLRSLDVTRLTVQTCELRETPAASVYPQSGS